jgi:uncharacterized membrane protein HdeD (DUF308 family)
MEKVNVKLEDLLKQPLEVLKKHTKMLKFEGVLMILLGVMAIIMPYLFSKLFELLFGIIFIIGGLAGLTRSFKAKDIPGTIVSIIFYLLFVAAGVLLISRPYIGVMTLAAILGFFFLISGFFKAIFAFNIKPAKNWGWSLLDGIISIGLGAIIFSEWPYSGPIVVGIIVGIRLLFLGNSMIMIGSGLQYAAENTAEKENKEPATSE